MTNEQMQYLDELHTELLETWKKKVTTWADFYQEIEEKVKQFQQCNCPDHMMDAFYSMYAFYVVMRDNPEEGDINVLIQKMCYTLVYEPEEKLNIKVNLRKEGDVRQERNVQGLATAAMMASVFSTLGQMAAQSNTSNPTDQEEDTDFTMMPSTNSKKYTH